MNSFYGMSQNQKPFVFDRIYGSYISALAAASAENGDGVYPGRYILIEYEHKDSGVNYNQEENAPTIYDQNKGRDNSNEVPTQRKNYDSTVWMKRTFKETSNNFSGLEQYYVNVADLNSPFISLNEVNPTINFAIPADPIGTRITDIPENTITLSAPNSTSGQLTQVLDIKIQSVGKAISDVYDKLYGESRDMTSGNTATNNVAGAINRINELIKAATTNNYLGVNEDDKWLADDGAGLKHINTVKNNTNQLTLSSFSNISITLTSPSLTTMSKLETKIKDLFNTDSVSLFTPNNTKLEYKLKTLNTDELGHVITVEDSSENKSIELPIGFTPSGLKNTTFYFYKNYPIYQNIGSIVSGDSFSDNLWSQIRGINKILGVTTDTPDYTDSTKLRYSWDSRTNIIGSSATTNTDTANLWGNIHNITTNIIGSSATTDSGTLWGNIHNINNIIGSSTITDPGTLWSNIDNITSNISSITAAIGTKPAGTSKTTIWSNIGSTNSTTNTLWGKVSSIDSNVTSISNGIGSSSDPTNTMTVWGNIERIDSIVGTTTDTSDKNTLYGKIKKVNDDLHYQIFEYEFEEPQYISSYALSSEITGASFTNNNTLIKDGITITKIGKTITINNNTTTLEEDCYKIPRKYKIIKKQYDNGKLECYGQITNIYIAYGGYYKQTGDYYSDYKNQQIVVGASGSKKHYAIPINTYILDDPSKAENVRGKLFVNTPDFIQLTAYGDNVGMWKDSEKLCTISKDSFFVTWYSAIKSEHTADQRTENGQYNPCYAFRGKWCKPNANLSADTNSCNSLSFHVIGRWE